MKNIEPSNVFKYAGQSTKFESDLHAMAYLYEHQQPCYYNIEDVHEGCKVTYYKLDVSKFIDLLNTKLNTLKYYIHNNHEYGMKSEIKDLLHLMNMVRDDDGSVYTE